MPIVAVLLMEKYIMRKYLYFAHAHYGCFVNFWGGVTARMGIKYKQGWSPLLI